MKFVKYALALIFTLSFSQYVFADNLDILTGESKTDFNQREQTVSELNKTGLSIETALKNMAAQSLKGTPLFTKLLEKGLKISNMYYDLSSSSMSKESKNAAHKIIYEAKNLLEEIKDHTKQ